MATVQGMCRNCGALIVFDDRDEQCECVFCHCVFPSAEALEIMADPEGRVFPNEKFEPTGSDSHHFQTRVYSDEIIEKAIKREKLTKATTEESVNVKNEFEVSPNDVKAPKKLLIGLIAGIVAFVVIIAAIAVPMKSSRNALYDKITDGIGQVYTGIIEVNGARDENGNIRGYCISGQTAQNLKLLTPSPVTQEQAEELFENYCNLRAQMRGDSSNIYSGVTVKIYCDGGIYTVKEVKGVITATYSDDADVTTVAAAEED